MAKSPFPHLAQSRDSKTLAKLLVPETLRSISPVTKRERLNDPPAAAPSFPPTLCLSLKERLGKGQGLDSHEQFIFEHVAPACGNLCRALGEDFAMFVPVVLPHLLAALEAEVKFSMEAADPDDDGEVSFTPGTWATLLRGTPEKWDLFTGCRRVVRRSSLWAPCRESTRKKCLPGALVSCAMYRC